MNHVSFLFFQIRIFGNYSENKLDDLIKLVYNIDNVTSIEIILNNSFLISDQFLRLLMNTYDKLVVIKVYNSTLNEKNCFDDIGYRYIEYNTNKVLNAKSCGVISIDNFVVNKHNYFNSLHNNSCLYNKISIDSSGNVKNCPSMSKHFGNISQISLNEAINIADFNHVWTINKDKISVCKDCEFRHVCSDCRAYIDVPTDEYSKPLKCGYDPYTSTWSEWSVNPLKMKAIVHYDLFDAMVNNITEINNA